MHPNNSRRNRGTDPLFIAFRIARILLVVHLVQDFGSACSASDPPAITPETRAKLEKLLNRDLAYWLAQLNKIKIGMSRSQVEAILPPQELAPFDSTYSGGSQTNSYQLDAVYRVILFYDYTGSTNKIRQTPQNQLSSVPIIIRKTFPVEFLLGTPSDPPTPK